VVINTSVILRMISQMVWELCYLKMVPRIRENFLTVFSMDREF
jgi:hypothetical protein